MPRSKPGQLVPYEWRATISLWTRDDELARALILRSSILSCFGHAEQKITDLVMRCSARPEYRDLRDKAPFTIQSRFKYLREVLQVDGPLSPFAGVVEAILRRYEGGRALRNRMAHADMEIIPHWGIMFDEIVFNGNAITHERTRYVPGELEAVAVKASRFSRAVQRLHYAAFGDTLIHSENEFDGLILLAKNRGRGSQRSEDQQAL